MLLAIASVVDENNNCIGLRCFNTDNNTVKDFEAKNVIVTCEKKNFKIGNTKISNIRGKKQLVHAHLPFVDNKGNCKNKELYTIINVDIDTEEILVCNYKGETKTLRYDETKKVKFTNKVELDEIAEKKKRASEEHENQAEVQEVIKKVYEEKIEEKIEDMFEGDPNCRKCKGAGWFVNSLGLKVTCSCIVEKLNKKENSNTELNNKPIYFVNNAQKEVAVSKNLIPEGRKDDNYDNAIAKRNIGMFCKANSADIKRYNEYAETLDIIMTCISLGKPLPESFLIGSPNGSGKTTFANTCIKKLDAMGRKAVPYTSLYELCSIKIENDVRIFKNLQSSRIGDKVQEGNIETEYEEDEYRYSWEDYMKADVVFLHMTTLDNMQIESKILKIVLSIRGDKGLPTIVFMDESLLPYKQDIKLKTFIWDEIETPKGYKCGYGRVRHVSCYRVNRSEFDMRKGTDY